MNFFLPGMGADGGMYSGPWRTIPEYLRRGPISRRPIAQEIPYFRLRPLSMIPANLAFSSSATLG